MHKMMFRLNAMVKPYTCGPLILGAVIALMHLVFTSGEGAGSSTYSCPEFGEDPILVLDSSVRLINFNNDAR